MGYAIDGAIAQSNSSLVVDDAVMPQDEMF
jgi:hypothetical protein